MLQNSPENVFCENAKVNKLNRIFVFLKKRQVFWFFEGFGKQISTRKGKLSTKFKKHSRKCGKSKEG
jgi:hypothetical protein